MRHMGGDSARIKLYGVVNGRSEEQTGVGSAADQVYTVSYREISCLVSETADDGIADKKSV